MPTMLLKFKENTIETYTLEKGKSLTIGRRDDNKIVIENLAVSGHHAKIDSVGDGFVLTDLQSKNGSFVNEQMITSHWLKDGDVISIGKHSLVYQLSKGETQAEAPNGGMDKTMVMDTSKYRNMLSKNAPEMPDPVETAKPKQDMRFDVPCVGPDTVRDVAAGGGRCLAIEAGKTIIIDKPQTIELADELGVVIMGC